MLDILQDYLNENESPEMTTVLVEAHKTFEAIGLENYEQDFESLLMTFDQNDTSFTTDKIRELTGDLLNYILHEHGIICNADTPIITRTHLVNGLLQIPKFEDKEAIEKLLHADTDPLERFCEIMELVSHVRAIELLTEIDTINDSILDRIRELFEVRGSSTDEEEQAQVVLRQRLLDRYAAFISFLAVENLRIQEILDTGIKAGYSFMVYANLIGRDFEVMHPDDAARNLVAIALLSSDASDNPIGMIKSRLEDFVANPEDITKIELIVSDLLVRFNQSQTSGVQKV